MHFQLPVWRKDAPSRQVFRVPLSEAAPRHRQALLGIEAEAIPDPRELLAIISWALAALPGSPESEAPPDARFRWILDFVRATLPYHLSNAQLAELAHERGKPVMIGESTPTKIGVHADKVWQRWYVPYFDLIRRNPGIKAICYINRNWRYNNLSDWLDSRIGAVPTIRNNWQAEIATPIYRHASGERGGRLVTRVAHGDAASLTIDQEGLNLVFEDLPAAASHLALNIAVDPRSGGEPVELVVSSGTQTVRETVKPDNGYRLETFALPATTAKGGSLCLHLSCSRPLRIDGPAVGGDGVPPTVVLIAHADR